MLRPTPTPDAHRMDAASQPHDRRRVPPARAGDRRLRDRRGRLPSAPCPRRSLGCGRCSPGGSTGHVITLGVAGSSPARSDVPRGRRSGSPASERPTSCKAITIRRRTGCPEAQAVLRRPGLEGTEYDMFVRPWLALSAYASRDLQTARATAAEIVRLGRRSRQPLGRGHRRVAAGRARTRPRAPRRSASTPRGQPRTVDRPTAPVHAGPVVARSRGAGQGGRGPRQGVGAGP